MESLQKKELRWNDDPLQGTHSFDLFEFYDFQ